MTRVRLALSLLAALGMAVAAPVPKKKADPFPYSVGTKWEYAHDGNEKDVWVEQVAEVSEKDGVVTFKVDITTSGGDKRFETYRLADGELVIVATQDGTFDPPMLIAKAGMKAGDEWENEWKLKGDGIEYGVKTTLTVGKAEEVTTPAGKYTATPVTRKVNGQQKTTFWFADGVGMIRQTVDGQKEPAQDLKAFTAGKK
jgi:hypothetical protein